MDFTKGGIVLMNRVALLLASEVKEKKGHDHIFLDV